ncbi:MAG TPA: NAD-dependent DNA ligase LigA, partial [Clostridiales bacterium]|nr:NAD-dependent DNA ligase LigA [Clostridiales bacterium]
NQASDAYYGGQDEVISNYEWDAMFDELSALEAETGYIHPDSPTRKVSSADAGGAEKNGVKEPHEFPALSLAKTKDMRELQNWAGDQEVWLTWKLDGLTLVLTYDQGKLTRILTRGNGTVGTNITFMKEAIRGIPLEIACAGHLVVRGEAVISYSDFDIINMTIDDDDGKYANPRNLASGTLNLDRVNLDKVKERNITFIAFTLVYSDMPLKSWGRQLDYLQELGFNTIDREKTDAADLPDVVGKWTKKVESGQFDIPVDGLVICYDDTEYAAAGRVTEHHATRAGLAFKWDDVSGFAELDHIEWSCAASTITPVAIFTPIQLEGTKVSRASLVNISEMERLGIGEDRRTILEIIKANKIIPKCIAVKQAAGHFSIPDKCPACGTKTEIRESGSGVKTLRCTNPDCPAKHLKRFARFVSKQGMDIDGLSIQTLAKFINQRFISRFTDIYHLGRHADAIKQLPGFGEKSYDNLIQAIERSRKVHPVRLIYALCIPMIGIDAGKKIIGRIGFDGFLDRLRQAKGFADIDGIGPEKSSAILGWYQELKNAQMADVLLQELDVEAVIPRAPDSGGTCSGQTFVITGDLNTFANRDALKGYIESQGGTATDSVSKKTSYLINNDVASESAKNKKAKTLGIPIISEAEFIRRFGS